MLAQSFLATCVYHFGRLIDRAAANRGDEPSETRDASDKYMPGHAACIGRPFEQLPTVRGIERNTKLCSHALGTIAIAGVSDEHRLLPRPASYQSNLLRDNIPHPVRL